MFNKFKVKKARKAARSEMIKLESLLDDIIVEVGYEASGWYATRNKIRKYRDHVHGLGRKALEAVNRFEAKAACDDWFDLSWNLSSELPDCSYENRKAVEKQIDAVEDCVTKILRAMKPGKRYK